MNIVVIVLSIVVLVVVVVGFHELGHFTFGKLFGIRVDEFSIGFGKKLVSRRRGETEYALRAIPLGGFVRMAGMINHPSEADAGERNFYRASVPKRIVTLLAGIGFNLILAGVVYSVAFMLPTPSTVIAGAPAAHAGLRSGDSVVSIGGMPIDHSTGEAVARTVRQAVNATGGRRTSAVYVRDGERHAATLTPQLGVFNTVVRPDPCGGTLVPQGDSLITAIDGQKLPQGDPVAIVSHARTVDGVAQTEPCNGVVFHGRTLPSGLGGIEDRNAKVVASWRIGMGLDIDGMTPGLAFSTGWGQIPEFFHDEYLGIKELITNPATGGPLGSNGFEGPLGIGAASVSAAQSGLQTYLEFLALISLNLAFINLVPIPFLDGGKALLVAIEGVRRRRLDPKLEMSLYAAGAALIMIFALYVTIGDIRRMFH